MNEFNARTFRPDFQPMLIGDLVDLRPLCPEDWEEMYAVASDPLIWAGHPEPGRCREPAFREYFESALRSGSALAIRDRRRARIIGCSRYFGHDPDRRSVHVGWTFLARAHWGGSYNGEVKRLMLAHAFRFVDTVRFAIAETNLRSRRAIEKIGAVWRRGADERVMNGASVRHLIYEIDKPPKLEPGRSTSSPSTKPVPTMSSGDRSHP